MQARNALAALGLIIGAPAFAADCSEVMTLDNGIQAKFCVSSTLKPQGANSYGPENLRLNDDKSWCEGVAGEGVGEWISMSFPFRDVKVRKITITNGYGKSAKSFAENSTVKTIEARSSKPGIPAARRSWPARSEQDFVTADRHSTATTGACGSHFTPKKSGT